MNQKILTEKKFHILKDGEDGTDVRWITVHFKCDPLTQEVSLSIENETDEGSEKMTLWEGDVQKFCEVIEQAKDIINQ